MGADTAVDVVGVSKRFRLYHQKYYSLKERVLHAGRNPYEDFWALRDVNLEVGEGYTIGIVGRNGSGKSTLLKCMAGILQPTSGKVVVRGSVAAVLELGAGFQPDLSGRENIYLNASLLGLSTKEVDRRFDEIVAFAEVERFLDTPVKRYSSGMYVRLAFAVAAHLEPEILVVDEVLAVGDAEFQKKCLGKMSEVAGGGRTVLFVSHNLAAINTLTSRAILLREGRVQFDGEVSNAISKYLSHGASSAIYKRDSNLQSDNPHLLRADVVTSDANAVHRFGEPLEIRFIISHRKPLVKGCFSLQIVNQFQQPVTHAWAFHPDIQFGDRNEESILVCRFPSIRLNVGQYSINTHLTEPPGGEIYERLKDICQFEVIRTDKAMLFGWDPAFCAYHETWEWEQVDARCCETAALERAAPN